MAKRRSIRSKNAVLPILAAALLCSSPVTIHRAPRLTDVDHMLRVLTDCGARIERQDRDITIYPAALRQPREPQNLHSLRASILVLGPLCVRLGEAIVPLPGGCAIGQRPVDIHLNGLRAMGAETEQADNCAVARGRLRGAEHLSGLSQRRRNGKPADGRRSGRWGDAH